MQLMPKIGKFIRLLLPLWLGGVANPYRVCARARYTVDRKHSVCFRLVRISERYIMRKVLSYGVR